MKKELDSENLKNGYFEISSFILKRDFEAFSECAQKVEALVKANQDIPSSLLIKYLGYYKSKSFIASKSYKLLLRKAIILARKVEDNFDTAGYRFSYSEIPSFEITFNVPRGSNNNDTKKKRRAPKQIRAFKSIIIDALMSYYKLKEKKREPKGKVEVILFFYRQFKSVWNKMNASERRKLSHYKAVVISAYMAAELGNALNKESEVTMGDNASIFEAVRKIFSSRRIKSSELIPSA